MRGNIRYGVHDKVCVLKLSGELAYGAPESIALSRALDTFLDHVAEEHQAQRFVIDMTDTEYIDSTNLGLLARIARIAAAEGGVKPHIITTRPPVTRTLETMGFRHLFQLIENDDGVPEPDAELPGIPEGERETARTVLRAHRALAGMNEHNAETFRPVIELLERELHEGRGEQAP